MVWKEKREMVENLPNIAQRNSLRYHIIEGIVSRERYIKATGEIQKETVYYISSLSMDATKRISEGIRKHWLIENHLHWHLDVSFGEDQCRIREEIAAQNFSSIRRIALSILQKDISIKASIRRKQLEALCDNEYLFSLFQQTIDNSDV